MMRVECKNSEAVVKRMFWLAWQACGGPLGMGVLQDKPGADEASVWEAAYGRHDYPSGNLGGLNKPGDVYGDYVFGRMMKLGLKWDETSVEFSDATLRVDYQAWCREYPTYQALFDAAVKSLST